MEFGELKGADGEATSEGGEQEKIVIEADQAMENNNAVLTKGLRGCKISFVSSSWGRVDAEEIMKGWTPGLGRGEAIMHL